MFALDIKKLEAHEKKLGAVSRLETSTPSGEILLMFFHVGEGWSERALIGTLPASDFAKPIPPRTDSVETVMMEMCCVSASTTD